MTQEELIKLEAQDRLKIRELCSTCQVRIFEILGQLDSILNVLRAIDVPELSSYTKIELKQEPATLKVEAPKVSTVLPSATNFKPPAKQSLTDLTLTLARNLELNLKKE